MKELNFVPNMEKRIGKTTRNTKLRHFCGTQNWTPQHKCEKKDHYASVCIAKRTKKIDLKNEAEKKHMTSTLI